MHVQRYHEIVKVLNERKLIDCESFERRYQTADGQPLAAGFYFVSWPGQPDSDPHDFDEHARFNGPYKDHSQAERALQQFVELSRIISKKR